MKAAQQFISNMAENISMPEVYLDIRQLIKKPDARIDDFVKIIETDSMLSVRVMRMANSGFFGFPKTAENLYQAISLFGVRQLHDVLLSCLCLRTFSSIPEQIINLRAFWYYGVQSGIAASTIARHSAMPTSNSFFTLGLLHEIGHAVLYLKSPELSFQALDASQTQDCTVTDLEREYLGFDYGELGAALMQFWRLPKVYQQVAAFHLEPQLADAAYRQEVQIIHLAHALSQNLIATQRREIISSITESCPQLRKLPVDIDIEILNDIGAHADSILSILWPRQSQTLPQDQ